MAQPLSKSDYHELLNEISRIYTRSNTQAQAAVNKARTLAYWEIGKRIITVEQTNDLRASYGERLIANLSADLTQKFGNGFSVSNLQYMRQFYRAYPSIRQTSGELPWSAYQTLSTIKDRSKREELTRKAAKNNWSVRELKSVLGKEKIELEDIPRGATDHRSLTTDRKLPAPQRGKLYTYRLKFLPTNLTMFPGDESRQGKYLVDAGFSVSRDVGTSGLKTLKDQMIVESTSGRGGYLLKESGSKASALYTYKAILERVVDGDTLACLIDLGFETWTKQKLRLRAIDCPELSTQKGQQAKKFVERELKGRSLLIKTHKTDKYDRYLVDVWFQGSEIRTQNSVADSCLLSSDNCTYLNQLLLDKGLANIYKD